MKVGDKNNIFTKCRLTELNAAAIFFIWRVEKNGKIKNIKLMFKWYWQVMVL